MPKGFHYDPADLIFEYPDDRDTAGTISVIAEYPRKLNVTFDPALSTPRRYGGHFKKIELISCLFLNNIQ